MLSVTGSLASTVGQINPFRYRGYYYDTETGFYYLQTRYYDPEVGRFINADSIIGANGGIQGYNMFAYCNNNPVMGYDPSGEAWWHWVIGAAVVAVCAVAVVATAGGAAAGVAAVAAVANGTAAATTASTVAAGAFIGSAATYGCAVLEAASTSNSVQEFNDKGNWGTVADTIISGAIGGYVGYSIDKSEKNARNNALNSISTDNPQKGQYTEPNNLKEQLSMEIAKSNPSAGKVIINELNDTRWPAGSVKMQQRFVYHDEFGHKVNSTIHYVMTPEGHAYDFKFVK